ncbi:MAG TPA: hypothetical protein VMV81_07070 [Phycisphaerae bacterium]|nr:hypothetical protein [Phycisphaerae bacterium]
MRKIIQFGLFVVLAGGLAGCAENKMTRQRFDMIKEGTSNQDEVRQTLGDPHAKMGNQWEYEDEHKNLHATVHFDDRGVVMRKEWMDGKTGEWSGAAPGIDESKHGDVKTDSRSHGTIHKD